MNVESPSANGNSRVGLKASLAAAHFAQKRGDVVAQLVVERAVHVQHGRRRRRGIRAAPLHRCDFDEPAVVALAVENELHEFRRREERDLPINS